MLTRQYRPRCKYRTCAEHPNKARYTALPPYTTSSKRRALRCSRASNALFSEIISANSDGPRRQRQVIGALDLGSPQHHAVKQTMQLLEGDAAVAGMTVLLDGFEDLVCPNSLAMIGSGL